MTQLSFSMEVPERPKISVADRVRWRLSDMLDELRAAETLPWTEAELRRWRTVVPQMCRWLPDHEAAAVRRDFLAQLNRLNATE